jgi:hypothetical protein
MAEGTPALANKIAYPTIIPLIALSSYLVLYGVLFVHDGASLASVYVSLIKQSVHGKITGRTMYASDRSKKSLSSRSP